ncbi:NADPH:quinone reductase [Leifsonia sp. LS1]|uniref:NADP-dependent oxidoreductase n=1 Tax=Leifsonia sp. LS1 TaxID=2828483 RepID=UPI001CFD263F|nr:NADP-dependent oxidoreductase [Leifsonia sp. LS1]GIT81507.1 NADPH:quinone reductase [Leifsonia sp. LS1]
MAETMRAIIQDELGGPDVLHEATVDRHEPGIGQVLLRVSAAGVNPADGMNRQTGLFSGPPPFVLGWDVSGVVEKVGPGVTVLSAGDEVFGLLPFPRGGGAYAEFAIAPARALVPKPARLSHVEAAALPLAGLTAWQALVETAGVGAGTRVLITGAAGGVGHLAVQLAAARGAHVIALTSEANADYVRSLGAAEVLDYRAVDFGEVLDDLDVVLDVVGGDYPLKALRTLRPGGFLVSTLPQSLAAAVPAAAEQGIRVAGLFVESDRLGLSALAELAAEGRLVPRIAATYPLDEAAAAHAAKHGAGKVVLVGF